MNAGNDTLPRLLFAMAERQGDRQALREKEFGIWNAVSWRAFAEHTRAFACGLKALGVQRGDTVAIWGDNRPEWLYAEFGAQSIGARSLGLYSDSTAQETLPILQTSDACVLVVEDQEQVDKVLEIWPALSSGAAPVRKVIWYYEKGMRGYAQPWLSGFDEIESIGRIWDAANPGAFERELAAGSSGDTALLSTTSGTTGTPKLAMLSHQNMIAQGRAVAAIDPLTVEDEYVSFLPLAWIGEQLTLVSRGMLDGFGLNFPESSATTQQNLREIGPSVMFSPPRIWENLLSSVQVKMDDSTRLKRMAYAWAMRQGYAMADARFARQVPPRALKLRHWLARMLVFESLKDQLGLRRLKRAYTGGAALGPDVFRFFHAIGVNLKQVFGQTESAGLSAIHRDEHIRFQSVGVPLPGTEIKLAENGEIMVRSPSVFQGYYKNPDATAAALKDGWLMTGDAGYFDDGGQLIVIDRAKDVMTLSDGSSFSPQFIENKLKFSQYVKEAVVFGGDLEKDSEFARALPFVTAFLNIEFGNVGKWAENNRFSYTTYADLAQKEAVYALVRKEVERSNADLPNAAKIKRFVLLHKELDADDNELTRTRKVRRGFIANRYRDIVDSMYGDKQSIPVETMVTYQDGRTLKISTTLRVERM